MRMYKGVEIKKPEKNRSLNQFPDFNTFIFVLFIPAFNYPALLFPKDVSAGFNHLKIKGTEAESAVIIHN